MDRIVCTLSLVLIANLLCGQSAFNFKAGINLSNAYTDFKPNFTSQNTAHHKNRMNGYAGVSAAFRISQAFYFVPELAYIGMGYKNPEDAFYSLTDKRLDYISLPLSLKYQANDRFSVSTGAYLSYLVGSEGFTKVPISNLYAAEESSTDLDGGILLGSEYLFYENWGLGVRYFYGLPDIDKDGDDNYKMFNRGLQFYIFYQLKNRKEVRDSL